VSASEPNRRNRRKRLPETGDATQLVAIPFVLKRGLLLFSNSSLRRAVHSYLLPAARGIVPDRAGLYVSGGLRRGTDLGPEFMARGS